MSVSQLQKSLSTLSLLTNRLDLASGDEEKKESRAVEVGTLIALLMLVYGMSELEAKGAAIKWLRRYTAAQIRGRVFRQVLLRGLRQHISKIGSLPDHLREQLVRDIIGMGRGRLLLNRKALERLLVDKYQLPIESARMVSLDQSRKYQAGVRQARQLSSGGTNYTWITRLDDRVRPTHQTKHGRQFSWLYPPADTGHPGEEINCRCIAIPVV